MSEFTKRLKELINEKQKTLLEIENETEIFHSNLSEFLSGKHMPSYKNLVALLYYFDCSADYLLGLDELPTNEPLHEILPFGKRLREVLTEYHVSQAKLIKTIGCSSSAIFKWLNGISLPSTDRLIAIAKCLDCSVDYLIGRRR